jgi:hypothetical protein
MPRSIRTTLAEVEVTVIDRGVHGIQVIMGDKIKRDVSDMLSDDVIEQLTMEIAESADPLGIDIYKPLEN